MHCVLIGNHCSDHRRDEILKNIPRTNHQNTFTPGRLLLLLNYYYCYYQVSNLKPGRLRFYQNRIVYCWILAGCRALRRTSCLSVCQTTFSNQNDTTNRQTCQSEACMRAFSYRGVREWTFKRESTQAWSLPTDWTISARPPGSPSAQRDNTSRARVQQIKRC
jgi:hypothetical protein